MSWFEDKYEGNNNNRGGSKIRQKLEAGSQMTDVWETLLGVSSVHKSPQSVRFPRSVRFRCPGEEEGVPSGGTQAPKNHKFIQGP